MANMDDVITLHNMYRRNVRDEDADPFKLWDGAYKAYGPGMLMKCNCCQSVFMYWKDSERISADRKTGGAYSRWCSQCASDDLGWSAEQIFMNARHEKNDRWLLTAKGSAALAAEPD